MIPEMFPAGDQQKGAKGQPRRPGVAMIPDYICAAMASAAPGPLLRAKTILGERMTWLGGKFTSGANVGNRALDGRRASYADIYAAAEMRA